MTIEGKHRFFKPEVVRSGIITFLLVGTIILQNGAKPDKNHPAVVEAFEAPEKTANISPTENNQTLNLLDYFYPSDPTSGLKSIHHNLNQVILSDQEGTITSYYVKFDGRFEEHNYDPYTNGIYLIRDNTDLENGPYSAPLGMFWLPGLAKVGDEFKVATEIYRYDKQCQPINFLPIHHEYTIKILGHDPNYNLGGDFPLPLDLVLVEYRQKTHREVFGYAKGIGWAMWELYDNQGTLLQKEIFNKKTNAVSPPNFKTACKAI